MSPFRSVALAFTVLLASFGPAGPALSGAASLEPFCNQGPPILGEQTATLSAESSALLAEAAGTPPPRSVRFLGEDVVVLEYRNVYDVHVAPDYENYPNIKSQPGGFDVEQILADLVPHVDSAAYDFVLMYTLHEVPGWINAGPTYLTPAINIGLANATYYNDYRPADWPKLRGAPHMNSVDFIEFSGPEIPGHHASLIASHEMYHHWGVFITYNEDVGPREWQQSDPIAWLAGCCAHWTWVWDEDDMPGIMYSGPTSDYFNEFDLYIMGLMGYDEASQVSHLVYEYESDPRILHELTLDDLIYALSLAGPDHFETDGQRFPDMDPSVEEMRILIVVVKGVEEIMYESDTDLLLGMADTLPDAWNVATWGRSSLVVKLPEPSVRALLLPGISLLGMLDRRRRRRAI